MRFHIFGLPHTVTNNEFCACAYTMKVRKFARMMGERGHEVIHYGHPDSDVPGATEHVDVISRRTFDKVYGDHDFKSKFFTFALDDEAYKEFFARTISALWERKEKDDFLLPFWGHGHRAICDAHSNDWGTYTVEPGIGYSSGHFAHYKIFESYSLYHAYCGLESSSTCKQNWYDCVIPNYFDLDEFTYREKKEDYLLFLGRVYEGKGIYIALQLAAETGMKVKIAGQNIPEFVASYTDPIPDCVEFIGYAGVEERRELMANAKGFILASKYIEPFGGTMVEALLSGTPCITTDWGAMAENNLHGITGYRCRTFDHFIWAANNLDKIDPLACRQYGENFSLDAIAPMYEEYFSMVLDQGTEKKWYTLHPERTQLDWMTRKLPTGKLRDLIKLPSNKGYDWELMSREETPTAQRLAKWLAENYPKHLAACDIGAGPGHWAESVRAEGAQSCDAYDVEPCSGVDYLDITKNHLNEQYDIAICLEVAEHVDAAHAESVVNNVIDSMRFNGVIVWSAAQPGQGGVGHVNCQTPDYWLSKFYARCFRLNERKTSDLIQHVKAGGNYMGWFVYNVMVLERFDYVCDDPCAELAKVAR